MKKLLGLAVMASAVAGVAGTAHAEGSFTGNVSVNSDYVFRGISQTSGNPALQGGIDYSNGAFYAGTWGSNVSFSSGPEIDLYAGVKPTLGPVSLDFGALGYFYPGAGDDGAEFDYYELKAAGSVPVGPASVGAAVFYSPDFFGETGTGWYYEVNGAIPLSDSLSLTAAYGIQDVQDYGDNYSTWKIGASYAYGGFTFGATYTDTEDAFENGFVVDETDADGALTFSIGKAL